MILAAVAVEAWSEAVPEACHSGSSVQKRAGLGVTAPTSDSVMESWIAGLSHHAELNRPLLAEDVHIRTIGTWLASFKDDQDDLWADGMTNVT